MCSQSGSPNSQKAPAIGVKPGCRHVDRAEAAMGGHNWGGTELRGPPAGQALRLVAAREKGQLARVVPAHVPQPLGRNGECFVPFDFAEFTRSPFAHTQEGLRQPRRGIMLLDAARTLATDDPLVDGVVPVAIDIDNLAILEVHPDCRNGRRTCNRSSS